MTGGEADIQQERKREREKDEIEWMRVRVIFRREVCDKIRKKERKSYFWKKGIVCERALPSELERERERERVRERERERRAFEYVWVHSCKRENVSEKERGTEESLNRQQQKYICTSVATPPSKFPRKRSYNSSDGTPFFNPSPPFSLPPSPSRGPQLQPQPRHRQM